MRSTVLTVMCLIVSACAFGAEKKSAPKKTSLTEAELRTIARATPNAKDAGTLYSVGMATNNVERQQEFLQASAACLLACGKWDVYQKHIRGKLANAAAFEESLKDKCKQCSGAGQKNRRCYVCSGKGKCSSCKGSGQTVSMGFDRPNGWKACHKCKGSGRCQKCGGGGSTKEKCSTCRGTGKTFQQSVAERVFRDSCNGIANRMVAEAKAKAEAEERERKRIADAKKAEERKRKRIAEANGDANELFKKGLAYYLGVDVQDLSLAIEYFSDAAELGCIRADAALAMMYYEGQGCESNEQNLTKCFIHAKKVAACDDAAMAEPAKATLGKLYLMGFRDEGGRFQQDAAMAYNYFSSCKTYGEALCMKGLMEYHGLGTVKDAAKAACTFKAAAKCANDDAHKGCALLCLGYLNYTGEGVQQDYKLASMLLLIGVSVAFPELAQTAKSPITDHDRIVYQCFLLGGGSPSCTALNLKILHMCEGIGKAEICGKEINLVHKALFTLFNPGCWENTGIQYDFISRLAGAGK